MRPSGANGLLFTMPMAAISNYQLFELYASEHKRVKASIGINLTLFIKSNTRQDTLTLGGDLST